WCEPDFRRHGDTGRALGCGRCDGRHGLATGRHHRADPVPLPGLVVRGRCAEFLDIASQPITSTSALGSSTGHA
nr:hypothetical protein [Tanacetum cinerariifolium]